MVRRIGVPFLALMLVGCGSTMGRPRLELATGGGAALVQSAEMRSAYFYSAGKICSEPAPDVALQQSVQAAAKVAVNANASGEASLNYASTVVQLAGRNSAVLMARDMFASICFQYANGAVTAPADIQSEFMKALEVASQIAAADADNAKANLVQASAMAAAVKDPATQALIKELLTKDQQDAATVINRFSRADGSFLIADFKAFIADSKVVALLDGDMANFAKISSIEELKGYVSPRPLVTRDLALLAAGFVVGTPAGVPAAVPSPAPAAAAAPPAPAPGVPGKKAAKGKVKGK